MSFTARGGGSACIGMRRLSGTCRVLSRAPKKSVPEKLDKLRTRGCCSLSGRRDGALGVGRAQGNSLAKHWHGTGDSPTRRARQTIREGHSNWFQAG
eukprot:521703-Prorocentrum_minimum.AAC.3